MSCDIAKLINEYELAAKKFRYSESQEWFEQKCKTYEAIVKAVAALEAENAKLKSLIERLVEAGNALDKPYKVIVECGNLDELKRWDALIDECNASKDGGGK